MYYFTKKVYFFTVLEENMKLISYYSYADPSHSVPHACSRESDRVPLLVNCAGSFISKFPFTTDNPSGRLDYYLMYMLSGNLTIRVEGDLHTVSAGDIVIFPPRYPYFYSYSGEGDDLNYLWVHFTGSHAKHYLTELGFEALPHIWHAPLDAHGITHFRSLFDIFAKESPHKETALVASLLQILLALSDAFSNVSHEVSPLARSLQYINASYTDDIQIPSLAVMENLSNSRYHVIFKKTVGMSPRAYITMLRLRHACELLNNTTLTVKQIGALVGYEDSHFFCKIFKSKIGMSPSLYRKDEQNTVK